MRSAAFDFEQENVGIANRSGVLPATFRFERPD
jgi:hypothetical protein